MQTNRNLYFDFLRGVAIIMVVGIHSISNTQPGFTYIEDICTVLLRMALNCAVPIFLAISGFFIASKKIKTSGEHILFLKRQIPKIYIPCLVFSFPLLVLGIITNESNLLLSIAVYFLCGFSVYYFIALIIQYYILLPLITRFNKSGGVILSSVISIISIILVTYLQKVKSYSLPLLIYAGPAPLWIIFFVMGVYFFSSNRNYSIIGPLILTITGFGLQILEYIFWLDKGQYALGIKLSSFIFSAGVIWLIFSHKIEKLYVENIFLKAIRWIGGISFGIYLLHCYIIAAIGKILPSIGWIERWAIVLCLTALVIWIVKLISPQLSKKYLGFR